MKQNELDLSVNHSCSNMIVKIVSGGKGKDGKDGKDGVIPTEQLAQITTNKNNIEALQNNKQDIINDLTAIRSGSALGATALQQHQSLEAYALKSELPNVPVNVSSFNNDAGYLTEHQSLNNYALKSELPTVDVTKSYVDTELAKKQNTLTAGDNISINEGVISATSDVTKAYVDGKVSELNGDIAEKLDSNLGAENSGKYLKVDTDGAIITDTVSGGVEEWETIADVTLTEDSKIVDLLLPANNKQFKKIIIVMQMPTLPETTNRIDAYLNGDNTNELRVFAVSTYKSQMNYVFCCDVSSGRLHGECDIFSTISLPINAVLGREQSYINYIRFTWYGGTYPSGTTFLAKGVR